MIEKNKLEKIIAFLNRRLNDPRRDIGISECVRRREDVGENEMINHDFVEDVLAESDEDPGFLIDEECQEKNGAYQDAGVLYIVTDRVKYGVPIEDIEDFTLYLNDIFFLLPNGNFSVGWLSELDVKRLIDFYHSCPTFGE